MLNLRRVEKYYKYNLYYYFISIGEKLAFKRAMNKTDRQKVGRCALTGRFICLKEAKTRKHTAFIEEVQRTPSNPKGGQLSTKGLRVPQ